MSNWSEEEKQALRRLWFEGLSGTQIGLQLNRSRNMVMGQAKRMGILGKRNVNRVQRVPKKRTAKRAKEKIIMDDKWNRGAEVHAPIGTGDGEYSLPGTLNRFYDD